MASDREAIRGVVEAYVTGVNRGDPSALREAFHARGVSAGFVAGSLQWDSAEDFAAFCAEAAPDPEGPIPDWRIETLVVSGPTAVAVVLDQWGARRFRDSLVLLKEAAAGASRSRHSTAFRERRGLWTPPGHGAK